MSGFCSLVLNWPLFPGANSVNLAFLPGWGSQSAALGYWLLYLGIIFSWITAGIYFYKCTRPDKASPTDQFLDNSPVNCDSSSSPTYGLSPVEGDSGSAIYDLSPAAGDSGSPAIYDLSPAAGGNGSTSHIITSADIHSGQAGNDQTGVSAENSVEGTVGG